MSHVDGLHNKIERKKVVEEHNLGAAQAFGNSMNKQISSMQTFLKKLQTDTLQLKDKTNSEIGEY